MRENLVGIWMARNTKYLPNDTLGYLYSALEELDDKDIYILDSFKFKDPLTMTIISIFLGVLGVDRFMIGSIGMGLFKLFTGGGFFFAWLYDMVTIASKCREYNYSLLLDFLMHKGIS